MELKAEYKRDITSNYLILTDEAGTDTQSYQIRMITTNTIGGMLQCNIRAVDDKIHFYYEISSKRPFTQVFSNKDMGYEDLQKVLGSIKNVLDQTAEYLLDVNCLILDPEYIYMDTETKEFLFLYFPPYQKPVDRAFHEFAEFLLNHLDYKDEQGVAAGYQIYKSTMEENYSIFQVMQQVYQREKRPQFRETEFVEKEIRPEEKKSPQKKEKSLPRHTERKYQRWKYIAVFAGLLLCFCGGAAWLYIYRDYLTLVTGAQIGGGLFLVIGVVSWLMSRKRQAEEQKVVEKEEEKEKIIRIETEEKTSILYLDEEEGKKMLVSARPALYPDIALGEKETLIGTQILQMAEISRHHARVEKINGAYYITDLQSTNGTSLNGEELEPNERRRLRDGDEIKFAHILYGYRE